MQQLDTLIHDWIHAFGWPTEAIIQLLFAAVAGGLVGIEREVRGRQAGFRTNLLVCVGSALVMIVSARVAETPWPRVPEGPTAINVDPARIAYGVMTGIGFLGAGVIVHQKGTVRGLTTAAGLWSMAAVGMAVGFGMYTISFLATILILATLSVLDGFEHIIPKLRYRTVTIRTKWRPNCVPEAVSKFKSGGLRVVDAYFKRHDEDPAFVDIHLRISFMKSSVYYAFERKIEADADYDLMAAQEI